MLRRVFSHDGSALFTTTFWSWCLVLCSLHARVEGVMSWSDWFDGSRLDSVSNETIDRIQKLLSYDCDNIENVICRSKSSSNYLSTTTPWHNNNIERPSCNNSENLCMLKDQIFFQPQTNCSYFEISFLCKEADTTQGDTSSEGVSVNGGFIAMAAGLSVVVPLICVLVMQLRRAKLEGRERERRQTEAGGGENGGLDPPPSYEQVFGQNYQAVSAVHSRNSSMDALIEDNEIGVQGRDGNSRVREAYVAVHRPMGVGNVINGSSGNHVSLGPRSNPAFSDALVSTISGSQVADIPVSLLVSSSNVANGSSALQNSNQPSIRTSILEQSSNLPSSSSPSTSSASTSSPPQPPPPPPLPPPRSPPPPFSSWAFRNTNRNSTGNSRIQETLRRLPGMHISIEDFFASLRVLQDQESEGPPPSYEEALKILESAALAKENVNIIK